MTALEDARSKSSPISYYLERCTPADVTAYYSSLALALAAINVSAGVTFESANRFYVDQSTSLKPAYQAQVESHYEVEVEKVDFTQKSAVANEINEFVSEATDGMIPQMIDAQMITDDMVAMFVNAIYFLGKWKYTLNTPYNDTFHGLTGDRTMEFMSQKDEYRVNLNSEFGTALVLPYQDESFSFFFLMPSESSNVAATLQSLDGNGLLNTLNGATQSNVEIIIPKFKVDSKLDAVAVLQEMGVKSLFEDSADLSKISSTPLKVSAIKHAAVIEVTEEGTKAAAATVIGIATAVFRTSVSEDGTKAAAATVIGMHGMAMPHEPPIPPVVINRPFIYGIMRNDDILFIGQFV